MIESVYGVYTDDHLKKMLASNSGIKNPNFIREGSLLKFPKIESFDMTKQSDKYVIVLSYQDTFQGAYRMSRQYKDSEFNVRIVSNTDSYNYTAYSVVINKQFDTIDEATGFKNKYNGIDEAICEVIKNISSGSNFL